MDWQSHVLENQIYSCSMDGWDTWASCTKCILNRDTWLIMMIILIVAYDVDDDNND